MQVRMPWIALVLCAPALLSQQQNMTVDEFEPKSLLVVPRHEVKRAKFPFIDVHNHQRDVSPHKLTQLIADMDSLNMAILVNSPVNGSFGDKTKASIDAVGAFNKDRFVMMTNIDYTGIDEPGYSERIANLLEQDFKNGAVAVKVWKNFGLNLKDKAGKRVPVDDPRFDAAWEMCAKYKRPVLIHTADPKGLFMPMDKNNERWLELKMRSGRMHTPGIDPEWETLIGEQHHLFRKHKNTLFINAHLGWLGFDLERLGKLLDECPNVYTEIGAVTSELGRQPRFAREWFTKYQDRVLFGKDAYNVREYHTYFRLLETADEAFDPIRRYHGIWKLYGLELPDDVLKKLYYKNALKIIPGLNASLFPN